MVFLAILQYCIMGTDSMWRWLMQSFHVIIYISARPICIFSTRKFSL